MALLTDAVSRPTVTPGALRSPLPQSQWSKEDVANWQYVNRLWRYPRALYAAAVDGPALLSLCEPLNATVLHDRYGTCFSFTVTLTMNCDAKGAMCVRHEQ
jgi:hypothetical protein